MKENLEQSGFEEIINPQFTANNITKTEVFNNFTEDQVVDEDI